MKITSLWLEPLVLETETEVNDFWWRTEGLNRYLFIYSVYTEQDKYARAKMGKDSSRWWTTLNISCHFWFLEQDDTQISTLRTNCSVGQVQQTETTHFLRCIQKLKSCRQQVAAKDAALCIMFYTVVSFMLNLSTLWDCTFNTKSTTKKSHFDNRDPNKRHSPSEEKKKKIYIELYMCVKSHPATHFLSKLFS